MTITVSFFQELNSRYPIKSGIKGSRRILKGFSTCQMTLQTQMSNIQNWFTRNAFTKTATGPLAPGVTTSSGLTSPSPWWWWVQVLIKDSFWGFFGWSFMQSFLLPGTRVVYSAESMEGFRDCRKEIARSSGNENAGSRVSRKQHLLSACWLRCYLS